MKTELNWVELLIKKAKHAKYCRNWQLDNPDSAKKTKLKQKGKKLLKKLKNNLIRNGKTFRCEDEILNSFAKGRDAATIAIMTNIPISIVKKILDGKNKKES